MNELALLLSLLQSPTVDVDADTLIRKVVNAEKLAEERRTSYTFDELVVETTYDKRGKPKDVSRKLFYFLSGENGEEGTRELMQIDGRPATAEEKKDQAEKDEKKRQKRIQDKAAQAAKPPKVKGTDDDPTVGSRKLSDLLARYTYEVTGEEIIDGHPFYTIRFRARPDLKASSLAEKAFSSLAGEAVVSAIDFQVKSVDARLIRPIKVAGGLAANVQEAVISYDAAQTTGRWFPCVIELHVKGKTALLFRLDTAYRFEFSGYQTFKVETEATVREEGEP